MDKKFPFKTQILKKKLKRNIFAKYPRSQIGSTDASLIIEDEKKGFTVLCTIDATILIATRNTLLCEENWFGQGRNLLVPKIVRDDLPNSFYGKQLLGPTQCPKSFHSL